MRSAKVHTVSAVITINVNCSHSRLSGRIVDGSHGSVLPGIFSSVGEHNVLPLDIQASIHGIDSINVRSYVSIEHCRALVDLERHRNKLRPHWVTRIWSLEPSKLMANLVHPLSAASIDTHSSIFEVVNIIVFYWDVSTVIMEGGNLVKTFKVCNRGNEFTESGSLTILNISSHSISNEKHELSISNFLSIKKFLNLVVLVQRLALLVVRDDSI
mmetsp:Transcript_34209/g.33413  ORF Transcript_34209/g.33413 Transcript_34209/m.33413 type:complete len:214 (-) Transcript_34209:187-828(-)